MSWKVGDIAICITPGSDMEGMEVEILSDLWLQDSPKRPSIHGQMAYTVDPGFPAPSPFARYVAIPQNLKRLPPANEITTWDESIFKPKELVT